MIPSSRPSIKDIKWSFIYHLILESNQFALVNPHWLLTISFLSFLGLGMASRRICSTTFPGTKVKQTGLFFHGSFFLPSLKIGVIFNHLHPSATSPDHSNLSEMIRIGHAMTLAGSSSSFVAPRLISWVCVHPVHVSASCAGYSFASTDSATRVGEPGSLRAEHITENRGRKAWSTSAFSMSFITASIEQLAPYFPLVPVHLQKPFLLTFTSLSDSNSSLSL